MTDSKICVVAIVESKGKIMIGKATNSKLFVVNGWHIPGGKVKNNEGEKAALIREIKEETGIEIKINKFLDEKIIFGTNTRVRWYLCSPISHNLKAGSDLIEVKFVPKSKVIRVCDPKAISLWPPKVMTYFNPANP